MATQNGPKTIWMSINFLFPIIDFQIIPTPPHSDDDCKLYFQWNPTFQIIIGDRDISHQCEGMSPRRRLP